MTLVFLACAGFCIYVYVLFPLWLAVRARRVRRSLREMPSTTRAADDPDAWPSVSVVIAAHDESCHLPAKIASLAAIDYPPDRLQIILVSDGSTDDTESICRSAAERYGWTAIHYPDAAGKPTALNTGVQRASGDILVFMDARQIVQTGAVRALVEALDDATVGAASGSLVLADDRGREAVNVSRYWQYERWIRQNESTVFSTTGVTGALYAVRRADYVPHRSDTLLDDFELPVCLLKRGLRSVFVPDAIALDQAEADTRKEFQRKVRTLAGNFQSFSRHPWLFDPRRNPVWWQFLSHKVFRLFVPYALLIALLACLLGDAVWLKAMLGIQLAFYVIGLAGLAGIDNRSANIVKLILQLNAAAVIGGLSWMNGTSRVRWKRT